MNWLNHSCPKQNDRDTVHTTDNSQIKQYFMIKRILKRAFLILVIIFALYLLVTNISVFRELVTSRQYSFIIDADTGNEQDDLYAIVRAIIEPNTDIIGLMSAQWDHGRDAPDSTVMISQDLNEEILSLMYHTDIPHPMGANRAIKLNGTSPPEASPAARLIINEARKLRSDEKLKVVVLGPMTNLASAVLNAPEIIPKLECYLMGLKYDHRTQAWNKNEFNTRNDLDAMDVLLDTEGLDLHIMTATTSGQLVFNRDKTFREFNGKGGVWDMLERRWKEKYPEQEEWVMWDIAIIEAIFHPEFATEKKVFSPPENLQRKIWVYTDINAEAMEKDFFKAVERFAETY